ncbi:MAG: DUF4258 domain-containing protein [Patulibacter sp.]
MLRFSRHAKRRLALYRVTIAQVEAALDRPLASDRDDRGNPRFVAAHPEHRYIRVVVAKDDLEFVIAVHPRRTLPQQEQ